MAKYVDADKLRLEIKNMGLFETAKFIKTFPSEDVRPVIHAHWIDYGEVVECSHCEWYARFETHYCPNCGAIMDEEMSK